MSEIKVTGEYPDLDSLRRAGRRTFADEIVEEIRADQRQRAERDAELEHERKLAEIRNGTPATADSLATKPRQWVSTRLKGTIEFSEDYQIILVNGKRRFLLTPQQAAIVRVLVNSSDHQASTQTLITEAKCGKRISDSFRGNGRKPWKIIVGPVEGCKGIYQLNLKPKD